MLLPPSCPACGATGPAPCAGCRAELRPAPALPPPTGLTSCAALMAYEGAGREIVARLKYANARSSLRWLTTGMADLALARADRVEVVTWVPTTPKRRRQRGFDHGRLLAEGVARHLGLPCRPLLIRLPGPPQTGRTRAERLGGPRLRTGRLPVPAGVLLVDDVVTTGASLSAANRALVGAGAREVHAVAAARRSAVSGGLHLVHGPRAGLWLKVDASRRRNDPRKATRGC
ncbi:MAG: ComF family protein [Acidimicrobiales bacterium]